MGDGELWEDWLPGSGLARLLDATEAERDALRAEVERLRSVLVQIMNGWDCRSTEVQAKMAEVAAAALEEGGQGVREKVIGFATLNGVLHLFTSADEFRAWMMAHQSDWSRAGWIDGAEQHGCDAQVDADVLRLRAALTAQQHEIQQTLGRALGYAAPDGTVEAGEHTAGSIADEAAEAIGRLRGVLKTVEWGGLRSSSYGEVVERVCPCCGATLTVGTHGPGCELASCL